MTGDLRAIKDAVRFEELVLESHVISHEGKVVCPFHCDHSPSCHIYNNGYYCFARGAYGDHIDWLKRVYKLSTAEAIRELKRRARGHVPKFVARHRPYQPSTFRYHAVSEALLGRYQRQAAGLHRVPSSMEGADSP